MIPKEIINELHCMADIVEDKAISTVLAVAAKKISCGEPLTQEENLVVEDELLNWETKDAWSGRQEKRLLRIAQAELGFLEQYNPLTLYSHKPTTWKYKGITYIV